MQSWKACCGEPPGAFTRTLATPPAGPASAPFAMLGQADLRNAVVGACPALLTISLVRAHPLGMFGGLAITWSPAGVTDNPTPLPRVSAITRRTEGIRYGRTQAD